MSLANFVIVEVDASVGASSIVCLDEPRGNCYAIL